jgi:hypothetical protein
MLQDDLHQLLRLRDVGRWAKDHGIDDGKESRRYEDAKGEGEYRGYDKSRGVGQGPHGMANVIEDILYDRRTPDASDRPGRPRGGSDLIRGRAPSSAAEAEGVDERVPEPSYPTVGDSNQTSPPRVFLKRRQEGCLHLVAIAVSEFARIEMKEKPKISAGCRVPHEISGVASQKKVLGLGSFQVA